MKKSRLLLAAIVYVAIGFCSLVLNTSQVHATAIANSHLTNLSDARKYVRDNRSGYMSYINGSTLLYHDSAGAGWDTTTLSGTVLTKNNDGSSDEKNACVDIPDNSFTFNTNIWANRGSGCGTNGTTSSGYSGGKVNVNPPNGVPVFLFIEDVDGLKDRQHITFTDSAIRYMYTPRSNPAFNVEGGNDLVSNGKHVVCEGEANCNAIVLLLANSFNIKAGSKDGSSVMRVGNNTPYPYRTLTFDPQGGSFPSDQLGREDDEDKLIREYADGANRVRDIIRGETSNEFPEPTKSGYQFQGWYDSPGGVGVRRTSWPMTSDKTLYAHWGPSMSLPYTLTPEVTVTGATSIEPGQSATFAPSVGKSGTATASNIHWELARLVVPPGGSIDMDTYSDAGSATVCAHYGVSDCAISAQANGVTFSSAMTALSSVTDTTTASLAVGSRLCYALLVSPYTESGSDYSQAIDCVLVALSPVVHVWGNDVRVGSSFLGGTNVSSGAAGSVSATNGSWVEYAITAPSEINLLASQTGTLGGSMGDQSAWSKLTFANNSTECDFGCFVEDPDRLGKIPDINTALTGATITKYNGASNIDNSAAIRTLTGVGSLTNFNISAAIVTTGDITIDQNIEYRSSALSGSQDIPQLILIGKNINIKSNVTRVDAWLIATDTINTCSDVDQANLSSDNCQMPLRINGPVMASQLLLHRTYHNATDPNAAAETINLRGDAYVWANRFTKQNGSWQTTYTTELPPRY